MASFLGLSNGGIFENSLPCNSDSQQDHILGKGFTATVQHSLPSAIIMLKSSQSGILNPKGLHTYVAEDSVSAEMSSFHEVVAGKRCAEGQ